MPEIKHKISGGGEPPSSWDLLWRGILPPTLSLALLMVGVQVGEDIEAKRHKPPRPAWAIRAAAELRIEKKYAHLQRLQRVLYCESGFDETAVGDGGLAVGLAQFHKNTFDWFKKKSKMPWLDYRSADDQILLLDWAVRNGYGRHWSCYRRMK